MNSAVSVARVIRTAAPTSVQRVLGAVRDLLRHQGAAFLGQVPVGDVDIHPEQPRALAGRPGTRRPRPSSQRSSGFPPSGRGRRMRNSAS